MRTFRHLLMTNTLIVVIALVALTVDVVFYLKAGAGWENSLWHIFVLLLVAVAGIVQGWRLRRLLARYRRT
ncbi:hypothetical protein [Alistipes putredinis]|uniref:hypothetical protein n=1 Tax=Alistipes putredinis TaxID=28117 RepID=UPI0027B92C75|nr:hypothetical protein [Alistipes putredinis]